MTPKPLSTSTSSPSRGLNVALWVLQVLLAAVFLLAGGFKLTTPADALAAQGMTMPVWVLRVAGASEVLGAFGLILPSLLRIQPRLTPIAASLLTLVVALAVISHLAMGQIGAIVPPLVLGGLCSFVAWGRFKAASISPKQKAPSRDRTMTNAQTYALRVAAVLWVVWGLVHMLAGAMVMSLDAASAVSGIADGVERGALTGLTYHAAAAAILKQHGWNLVWIGTTTLVSGALIWRRSMTAIWIAALVGGMADLGYFIFLDLPGHVNFVPGTVMTLVSGSAITLSGWVWFKRPVKEAA